MGVRLVAAPVIAEQQPTFAASSFAPFFVGFFGWHQVRARALSALASVGLLGVLRADTRRLFKQSLRAANGAKLSGAPVRFGFGFKQSLALRFAFGSACAPGFSGAHRIPVAFA